MHRVRKTELIDVIGSFPKESDTCLEPGGAASANGSNAALGVRSKFSDGRRHAFALWWDKEKVYASVWTEFQNRAKAQKAVKCRRAVDSGIEVDISDGCTVWMRLEVSPDDAHDPWNTSVNAFGLGVWPGNMCPQLRHNIHCSPAFNPSWRLTTVVHHGTSLDLH